MMKLSKINGLPVNWLRHSGNCSTTVLATWQVPEHRGWRARCAAPRRGLAVGRDRRTPALRHRAGGAEIVWGRLPFEPIKPECAVHSSSFFCCGWSRSRLSVPRLRPVAAPARRKQDHHQRREQHFTQVGHRQPWARSHPGPPTWQYLASTAICLRSLSVIFFPYTPDFPLSLDRITVRNHAVQRKAGA